MQFAEARIACARAYRMAVLSELRYPTTRIAKLLSGLFAIALFLFVSVAAVSGFLLYQMLRSTRVTSNVDLNVMMGHPVAFSFPTANGGRAMAGSIRDCAGLRPSWCVTGFARNDRMS